MADEMLRETQIWLNKTYSGVTGFNKVPEDGQTRNKTYYGLIRALQIELGITKLADSFGPTTESAFKALTKQSENAEPRNLNYILQGGFWTKGYSPGGFNGMFLDDTESAVKRFQRDIGIEQTGVVTAQVMKALLNTDGFTLSSQGTSNMRTVQQFLNATYGGRYFTYIPTNGVYERNTNKALIYGLQAEMGMSTSVANGNFGPGTTNGCPVLYEGDSGNNVKLLQGALLGNGYDTIGILGLDGRFDSGLKSKVIQFQKDLVLPQTGIADMPTIKQLLSSAGHTGRSATVCDTATILNSSNIKTLKNNGYKMVGRYLTGTVGGTRSKALTNSELNLIFSNGLKVFPIYQDGGYYSDYFVEGQGVTDANTATAAARSLGFQSGTTIYFAVDFDAYDFEIKEKIIRYFREIKRTFQDLQQYSTTPHYNIGVYGPRNACIQVFESGYADYSFVSNMSTGFSGNLGFPMPSNWSFSQFFEQTIYSGSNESIGIDKVDYSGKDSGVSSVSPPSNPQHDALLQAWTEVGRKIPFLSNKPSYFTPEFEFGKEFNVVNLPGLKIDAIASRTISIPGGPGVITVSNGKPGIGFQSILDGLNVKVGNSDVTDVKNLYNDLALTIGNGVMEAEIKAIPNGTEMKFTLYKNSTVDGVDVKLAVALNIRITSTAYGWELFNARVNNPAYSVVAITGAGVIAFLLLYSVPTTGGSTAPAAGAALSALASFFGINLDEDDK
ncbi:glycoside hydrolase domain-containing protein [Terribacillus saccharophilus]|nr:glycoside hydrolase domain-containing protein [Terribacillus saccharophilus]